MPFHRVVGIDISGARDAGDRIWIAVLEIEPTAPRLVALLPARDLPEGDRSRPGAFAALRRFISKGHTTLYGLDVPFSLPEPLLEGRCWRDFIEGFTDAFESPEQFRAWCQARSAGRELRRDCDTEARTPWSAYNLRLFRQTFWALREIIGPLVSAGDAAVAPLMEPGPRQRSVLIEVCPGSALKKIGLYRPYKGPASAAAAERDRILAGLERQGLRIAAADRRRLLDNAGGDALDALIAACVAREAARVPECLRARMGTRDATEARVYFEMGGPGTPAVQRQR